MPVISPTGILLLLLASHVATQVQTVQDDWVFPQLPDYSTTLEPDQNYMLKWTSNLQNWFPYYCEQCNPAQVDIWVVAADGDSKHKIASDIDVTSTLSLAWSATVPALELENAKIWSFQFVPKDVVPAQGAEQISSPQFNLRNTAEASSASSTSSSITSKTSTTIPASMITSTSTIPGSGTTTSMPSPTNTSEPQRNATSGLSSGVKAGIGVGVSVGALVLVALGWFLARRHKRSPMTTTPPQQDIQGMVSPHSYASPNNFTSPQQLPSPQNTAPPQHTVSEPSPQGSTKVIHEVHGTPSAPHPPFQPPLPFQRDST